MNAFLIVIIIVATLLLAHGLLVLAYALSPKRALQRRLDQFVRRS